MIYTLDIAGLGFRLESPIPMALHAHYVPYLNARKNPDVIIRVLSDPPLYPAGAPVFSNGRLAVYPTPSGWFREHRIWVPGEKQPGNPCLVPEADGSFSLRVPEERLSFLANRCEFLWLLAPEARLAERRRMILHAASVVWKGKAWLFFGPSGIGKSTHSAEWIRTLGAEPLTGDRTVLAWNEDGRFLAYGSPFCGSSELCLQKQAPLGGLCLLGQAPKTQVEVLSAARAFRALYAHSIVNSWDSRQTALLCDEIAALAAAGPVYRLECRPGPESARLCAEAMTGSAD